MKNAMNSIKNAMKTMWKDESAQGATEYILILVIIVGAVIVFGGKIKAALSSKTDELTGGMDNVKVQ